MITSPSRKVFVNLPVRDLKRSMRFFEGLGFRFNPQFTDDNAACMTIVPSTRSPATRWPSKWARM